MRDSVVVDSIFRSGNCARRIVGIVKVSILTPVQIRKFENFDR